MFSETVNGEFRKFEKESSNVQTPGTQLPPRLPAQPIYIPQTIAIFRQSVGTGSSVNSKAAPPKGDSIEAYLA
jgi:hypothetical protein